MVTVYFLSFMFQYLQGLEGKMESVDQENARLREENCLLRKRVEELTTEVMNKSVCLSDCLYTVGVRVSSDLVFQRDHRVTKSICQSWQSRLVTRLATQS